MKKKKKPQLRQKVPYVFFLCVGIAIGYQGREYVPLHDDTIAVEQEASTLFDIRFSPRGGCLNLILHTLAQAKNHIYVQAYSFTSVEISDALIAAHQRGVKVIVLGDKESSHSRYSKLQKLIDHGIAVRIDKVSGLAHNKIMIVDDTCVITGSFNWSANAEKRNAENIIRIKNKAVNNTYNKNFFKRYDNANPL